MEITYELDKKDIVAFQLHHYRTAPAMRRFRHVSTLLFGALFAHMIFTSGPAGLVLDLVFYAIGMAVFWMMHTFGMRLALSYLTRAQLSKRRENGVTGRHRVTLTPEKFVETTSVNDTHTLWRGVDRVEQNDHCIHVFITPQAAVIVPKRAFLDARQAREFYETAVRFHEGARADVPRPTAAEIERAARLDVRPASQFDERHLSPVERVFSE